MKYYSIFFSKNGKTNWMPIYEGRRDGRYWLGGTASLMFPLIFSSKKKAEKGLRRVLLIELEQVDEHEIKSTIGMFKDYKLPAIAEKS